MLQLRMLAHYIYGLNTSTEKEHVCAKKQLNIYIGFICTSDLMNKLRLTVLDQTSDRGKQGGIKVWINSIVNLRRNEHFRVQKISNRMDQRHDRMVVNTRSRELGRSRGMPLLRSSGKGKLSQRGTLVRTCAGPACARGF